jgi:hypothetical protein
VEDEEMWEDCAWTRNRNKKRSSREFRMWLLIGRIVEVSSSTNAWREAEDSTVASSLCAIAAGLLSRRGGFVHEFREPLIREVTISATV